MPFLLSLFSSKTTWMLVAGALLALLFGVQQARISHLKNKIEDRDAAIAAAQAELKSAQALILQWKSAYDGITVTVDRQNAHITILEAKVKERIAKANEAMKQAEKAKQEAANLVQTIATMELSKDECQALSSLVDSAIAGGLQ